MPKQATGSTRHRLGPDPSSDSSTPATAPPAIPAPTHDVGGARGSATVLAIAERADAIITVHDRVTDQASAVYTLLP
jgi:hypothetical protein